MSKTPSIITLGSFDGVHRGHQAIFKKIVQRARVRRALPAALIFGMPPRFTRRSGERFLLTTLAEKKELLRRLGIRRVQVLVFDKKTAATLPADFFTETILRRHRAAEMVVGPRVAFGKDRAGKLPLLRALGKRAGVAIHVIQGVGAGAHAVSSSAIRDLLRAGRVERARRALGYTYEISGRVIKGDQRGRGLGFPTANLAVDEGKILPPGVYWVYVRPLGLQGLCNVGTRPTFTAGRAQTHVEVFLFGHVKSLYGRRLKVYFLRRLRAEKAFAGPSALVRQIGRDVARAKQWRKSVPLQTVLHSI